MTARKKTATTVRSPVVQPRRQIVLVDDHPMMRLGLAQLINLETDLQVCAEAETAAQGFEAANRFSPDLVILDISLPDKSGLELIKDLQAARPGVVLLVLSMHDENLYAERALRAGARGYIMKQEGGKKLMEAIRQVLEGRVYVSEKMSAKMLESFSGRKPNLSAKSPIEQLTDREFEVFELLGQGRSTKEIADHLHLSGKTVEVHRLNIKTKLGLNSAPELIRAAVRWVEAHNPG